MRVNSDQLIKLCGTLTDPAAETKSIGLPADTLVPCFLLAIWTISSWPKTHIPYPDLVPSRQFHRDQWVLVRLPGLAKKLGTSTRSPTQLNRRAVRRQSGPTRQPVFVRKFRHDVTIFCHLSGLLHLDSFIITWQLLLIYQDKENSGA